MQVSAVRKPEAGRHKGDLGGSVAKISLIIMFAVFLFPILANLASK